jgi:hypothetical protein
MAGIGGAGLTVPYLGSRVTRNVIDFALPAWNTVATHRVFAVSGLVRIVTAYRVLTNCGGAAGCLVSFGLGAAPALCWNAQAIALLLANTFPSPSGIGAVQAADFQTLFEASNRYWDSMLLGLNVGYEITVAAANAGKIEATAFWTPLSSDGRVTPAAGGPL